LDQSLHLSHHTVCQPKWVIRCLYQQKKVSSARTSNQKEERASLSTDPLCRGFKTMLGQGLALGKRQKKRVCGLL